MLSDAQELEKIKKLEEASQDDELLGQIGILEWDDSEKLKFHKYMKGIAQKLLGDSVNLDEENLVFLLSKESEPNAAHVPADKDRRFIYVTKGLLNVCENEAQLAYILGHELQHWMYRKNLTYNEIRNLRHMNTKAEEESCDLLAVTKMRTAGYDIEDAYKISKKLFVFGCSNIFGVIDEHPLSENRLKYLSGVIKIIRDELIKKNEYKKVPPIELYNPDISQYESNWVEKVFKDEKYLNASYDEKVKIWFSVFDKLSEGPKKISRQYVDILWHEQAKWDTPDKDNYTFDEMYFDRLLAPKTLSDFEIVSENLRRLNNNTYISEHKSIVEKIKAHFKNFRESRNEETALYRAKLEAINGEYTKGLIHAIFNLSDDERKNIGVQFSPDVINTIRPGFISNIASVVSSADETCMTRPEKDLFFHPHIIKNKNFSSMICLGEDLYLLDQNNQILQKFGTKEELKNINMAQQYNDYFEFYDKIEQGKLPLTQINLWKILDIYSKVSKLSVKELKKIEEYLSPQAAQYLTKIKKDPFSWGEEVSDILCKYMRKKDKTPEDLAHYENFMQSILASRRSGGYEWYTLHKKKLLDVYFETGGTGFPSGVCEVTTELLQKHLQSGKSIDDFVFPYDKQFYDYNERFFNDPSLRGRYTPFQDSNLNKYACFELLKKNPKIDLSQMVDEPLQLGREVYADSYLSDYFPLELREINASGGWDYPLEIYNRLYENITNLDNWGDGSSKISKMPYYQRVTLILSGSKILEDRANQAIIDVLKNHYKRANIDDKIKYLVPCLETNTLKSFYRDMFYDDNWELYKQDLQNGDIPLKKRLQLANKIETLPTDENALLIQNIIWKELQEKIASPDLPISEKMELFNLIAKIEFLDPDKSKYFETLLGKDKQSGLLREVDKQPQQNKFNLYFDLLVKENRIPDPKIRSTVIRLAVHEFAAKNGNYNDITASPKERDDFIEQVKLIKEQLKSNLAVVDEHEFLRCLADATFSQQKLSAAIKPNPPKIDVRDADVIRTAYALDGITYLLDREIIQRDLIIEYILSEGKKEDSQKMMDIVQNYRITPEYQNSCGYEGKDPLAKINESTFTTIKKEFDQAPLAVQACIMSYLAQGCNWEHQFEIVADKLFQQTGKLGEVSKKFLKSYISSRPESERHLYLSAMYSASQNKSKSTDNYKESKYTKEERSVAEGLRLFLENSGPAGVKLAQAMSSYANVPNYIKDEMQKTKNSANPPARWEIFDWLQQTGQTEALKHGKIGTLLGSASFFVTYDMLGNNGKDSVIKINRLGSANKAEVEFDIYKETLNKLQKDFPQIFAFKRLIDNASDMASVETDLKIGEEQLRYAQTLYPQKVNIDGKELTVSVMDWTSRGETWAIMDKAQGKDFGDLSPQNKKTFAKAIVTMEFANMLSGQRFDSDRHSGQYKIDETTNTIGIFDTGNISIIEPTEKERRVLGIVLANTVKRLGHGEDSIGEALCTEIEKAIKAHYKEEINKERPIPPFLSEFQRGVLALTDFHKELNGKELIVCLLNAMNFEGKKLDQEIYKGFIDTIKKKEPKNSSVNKTIKMVNQVADIMEKNDTKDEQGMFYQQKGRELVQQLVGGNENSQVTTKIQELLKTGGLYEVLTNFSEFENDRIHTLMSSKSAQIQFAKGIMKQLIEEIDPNRYSVAERQQIGDILYKVNVQSSKNQILHKKEDICDTFLKVVEQEPNLGKYATKLKNIAQVFVQSGIGSPASREDFSKAVILARFSDSEVQKGYNHALRQNPNESYLNKIASRFNIRGIIPNNTVRVIAKFAIKEVAPYYIKMMRIQTNIKQNLSTKKMKTK